MRARLNKGLRTLAVLLFWLLIWQLAAALVGQELLLPSPLQVARKLLLLAGGGEFWLTLARSILRVLAGIVSAVLLGILLAMLTHRSAVLKALLQSVYARRPIRLAERIGRIAVLRKLARIRLELQPERFAFSREPFGVGAGMAGEIHQG